jgi:hypothetical protein
MGNEQRIHDNKNVDREADIPDDVFDKMQPQPHMRKKTSCIRIFTLEAGDPRGDTRQPRADRECDDD